MKHRNSPTQLPVTLMEQRNILETDAQRKLPDEKQYVHYPDLGLLKSLLESCKLPTEIFDQTYADTLHIREILDDPELKVLGRVEQTLQASQQLIDQLVSIILEHPSKYKDHLDILYQYLSEEDDLEEVDVILVCGWKHLDRAQKAIELYRQGVSPILLFSGGHPRYDPRPAEALIYRDYALQNGIAATAILTEEKSISLPGNIIASLNLLEDRQIPVKRIRLVCSPFAQRRAWSHLKKFTPDNLRIVRMNATSLPEMTQETWLQTESSLKRILNEFFKMLAAMMFNTA